MKKVILAIALMFTTSLVITSCRDQDKQTVEEKIEAALDEIEEDINNASDDVQDTIEDVKDEIKEAKEEAEK